MADPNEPSDEMLDEIMSVLASMTPQELAAFAEAYGVPVTIWQDAIANWKAERLQ